jgi:hypothetical protein
MACSFGFGLWAWPLEASHYARPKAPLTIFYWLFWAHFFGLSTKLAHSIPRPLHLDGHSVKRPLVLGSVLMEPGAMWSWCDSAAECMQAFPMLVGKATPVVVLGCASTTAVSVTTSALQVVCSDRGDFWA